MSSPNPYARFNQFRFFTYLFTGGAFLLGLAPLTPTRFFNQSSVILLTVGILLSYLAGQAFYEVTALLQFKLSQFQTHRELLCEELDDPDKISREIINEFINIFDSEVESFSIRDDNISEDIYIFPMIVGYIQFTSQCFSLQLRSTYTFFRNMILINTLLMIIYTVIFVFLGTIKIQLLYEILFTEYYEFYFVSLIILILTLPCWWFGYSANRLYYVEYLLTDYINLKKSSQD